jgi:hypothetical protein
MGVCLAALALAGCAEIRLRTQGHVMEEQVLRTRQETKVEQSSRAEIEARGKDVTVVVHHECATHRVRDVERRTVYERYDANARGNRAMGITGAALAAGGGFLVALPAIAPRTSTAADMGIGAPLATLGVTLATLAIIGVAKARAKEEIVESTVVDDGRIERVPCDASVGPMAGVPIVGKVVGVPGGAFDMGVTDDAGRLAFDLTRLSGISLHMAPSPKRLVLYAGDDLAGSVDLSGVEPMLEEKAWRDANVNACAAALEVSSCFAVEQFLRDFPDSVHVGTARGAIERGRAIQALRDKDEAKAQVIAARDAALAAALEERRARTVVAAEELARRAAVTACIRACATACRGDVSCASSCVARTCGK